MGEAVNGAKGLHFDRRIKLEFRGAKVTTDAGLLLIRELDEALGLTEMATCMLSEARAKNRGHDLAGLLRQSVYARLAGYEDVNDQEALSRDPAMRAVIGRKALERNAASSATISRFETEILAAEDNLDALAWINGAWVARAIEETEAKKVILDMDSSESPVHGQQEGSAGPTKEGLHATDGTGTGPFASSITGLSPGTLYHVRAWATNSVGTSYGEDLTFTTGVDLFAWYLAEGCTSAGFETWILVENTNAGNAMFTITLDTDTGQVSPDPLKDVIIAPLTRMSFRLNDYVTTYDVSARVAADKPVVCERAMYGPDRVWATCSTGYPR